MCTEHACHAHKTELSATQGTASCFIQRYGCREKCVHREKGGKRVRQEVTISHLIPSERRIADIFILSFPYQLV